MEGDNSRHRKHPTLELGAVRARPVQLEHGRDLVRHLSQMCFPVRISLRAHDATGHSSHETHALVLEEMIAAQQELKKIKRAEVAKEKKEFSFASTLSGLGSKEVDVLGDGSVRTVPECNIRKPHH